MHLSLLRSAGVGLALCVGAGAGVAFAAADGASLLFAKGKGRLTESERREIFAALELELAPDGKSLVDPVCEQPTGAEVRFSDMNGDRADEVLVTYGNTCFSGFTGQSVVLFIKDASGKYRANLGFPGLLAEEKSSRHQGYPDLLIGGPGFCFPVWRWNGKEYAHHHDEPQQPGGCDQR